MGDNSMKTTGDLIVFLRKNKFEYYQPAAKTWHSALVGNKGKRVLCILLRKNGIDFRLYDNYKGGLSVNKNGHLIMNGGKIYRNYFNNSKSLLTLKASSIAEKFNRGILSNSITKEDGESYRNNENYEDIRKKSREEFEFRMNSLKENKEIIASDVQNQRQLAGVLKKLFDF